jgi:hypothetical protein
VVYPDHGVQNLPSGSPTKESVLIEDGEVVELVTVTDALEAAMGELRDPLDRQAELQ